MNESFSKIFRKILSVRKCNAGTYNYVNKYALTVCAKQDICKKLAKLPLKLFQVSILKHPIWSKDV